MNELFEDEDFYGHSFKEQELISIKFQNCTIAKCNFDGAKLHNVQIKNCTMEWASCKDTFFDRVTVKNSNLANVDFRGSNIVSTRFLFSDLRGCDFSGASVKLASFYGSIIKWVKLDCANISRDNRELICEILRQKAGNDIEKRKIAGLISISEDLCWDEFLKMEDPLKEWALDILRKYIKYETQ